MSNITVYSKKSCPNCDLLKKLLMEKNIEHNIVRIDTPAALTELRMNSVFTMSAPVLQIGSKFYTLEDMATHSSKESGMIAIDQDKVMGIIGSEVR